MSVNSTNPSALFGGTWVTWGTGRVPVGVNASDSNFNTVDKIGGVSSVNLAHTHTVNSHTHTLDNSSYAKITTTGDKLTYNYRGGVSYWTSWTIFSGHSGAASGLVASEAVSLGGETDASTSGTSSGLSTVNNLQPYITCYMWKRTR